MFNTHIDIFLIGCRWGSWKWSVGTETNCGGGGGALDLIRLVRYHKHPLKHQMGDSGVTRRPKRTSVWSTFMEFVSPDLKLYEIWKYKWYLTQDGDYCSESINQSTPPRTSQSTKRLTCPNDKEASIIRKNRCNHGIGDLLWPLFVVNHRVEVFYFDPQFKTTTGNTTKHLQSLKLLGFPPAPNHVHPFSCIDDWERMLWPSPPTTSAMGKTWD